MSEQPMYRIDKEKGVYKVRKFVGFDHSWAEYSEPVATFDTTENAQDWIEKESNQCLTR